MSTDATILRKNYSAPYVLDRGKFSRILTVIEQRLTDASVEFLPGFDIELKNEKKLVLRSAQEVFALDNSVKNPISELIIRVPTSGNEDEEDDEDEGSAGGTRVRLRFDSDNSSNIALYVASPDSKLATELFAEIEEQIDRTIVRNWILRFFKSDNFLAFVAAGVLMAMMAIAFSGRGDGKISSSDSAELQRILATATTDGEKLNALVQAKIRELKAAESSPLHFNWASMVSLRGLFIVLPIVVLIATVTYMIAACYPWAVFAWGDYEQHYADLVGRRKTLGAVVIAALIIGVVANLFVAAIPALR